MEDSGVRRAREEPVLAERCAGDHGGSVRRELRRDRPHFLLGLREPRPGSGVGVCARHDPSLETEAPPHERQEEAARRTVREDRRIAEEPLAVGERLEGEREERTVGDDVYLPGARPCRELPREHDLLEGARDLRELPARLWDEVRAAEQREESVDPAGEGVPSGESVDPDAFRRDDEEEGGVLADEVLEEELLSRQ